MKKLTALFLALVLLGMGLLGSSGVYADDTHTVTFNLNYEGAPEPTVTTVEDGKTVKAPGKPTKPCT